MLPGAFIVAALLAWGATVEYRELTEPAPVKPGDVIEEAIAQLRQRALNASRVDWVEARRAALDTSRSGRRRDLDIALGDLVRRLEDGHSSYLPARAARPLISADGLAGANPLAQMLPAVQGVPRLAVNSYASLDPDQGRQAAAGLRQLAMKVMQEPRCGLLLDLTSDRGGNMYPMLQGLSPLLPDGVLLQFENRSGSRSELRLAADGLWLGEALLDRPLPGEATVDVQRLTPIAVLTGPGTASSGEMVALAFKALENVRFFGRTTAGLTSGNEVIPLKHGGMIAVTTTLAVDRTGHVYRGGLTPDEVFQDDEAAAIAAVAWVKQRCGRGG